MFKLVTDISIIGAINNAAKIKEGSGVNYCDIIKHPIRNEYAIPIIVPILKSYNLDFITDEWLSSGLVSQLPDDWTWLYPDEPIRIIIPNYLILKDESLKSLISYCDAYDVLTYTNETHTFVYVYYIMEAHRDLFSMFKDITIEEDDN